MTVIVQRREQAASDGFVLVAVLWILSALAALAAIYAIYVANTAVAVAGSDDAIEADALMSASVELTAYQLFGMPTQARPTRGAFDFRLGRANVAVEFCSEAARVDLNEAPNALLSGLFIALGAQPDAARQYVDRVVGWRTTPKTGERDEEAALYRASGLPYFPRGAPFEHVGELGLVLGLPPALVERALPHVTVFSGLDRINARDAAPEVLAAIPGMAPDALAGAGRTASVATRPGAQEFVTTEGSPATRVTARISFDNGRRMASEAVIFPGDGNEPFRILSWRADIDVPPTVGFRTGPSR
jgi:general secretion pathway protein K